MQTGELHAGDDGPTPQTAWHVTGVHVDACPTLDEGRLFVGSVLGDIYRQTVALGIDARSGDVLWLVPAPLPLAASPAAANGRVYFTLAGGKLNEDPETPEGRLWCLNAADGGRLWEFRCAGGIFGSPVLTDDLVICAARDGNCYAFETAAGKPAWKQDLGEPAVTTPIVSGGRVFVLTIGGSLVALNANSGDILWRLDDLRSDDADVYSSPVLVDGRIYAASGGKLYCIGDAAL